MTRSSHTLLAGAALLIAGCAGPASAPQPVAASAGPETITASGMRSRVGFLASDALRGRDTPSPGLDSAAAYIVREYRRMGLQPAGENGTFHQYYPFPATMLDTATAHFGILLDDGEDVLLRYGVDFFAQSVPDGPQGPRATGHGRLVWAGRIGTAGLPDGDYGGAAAMVLVPGGYSREWRSEVARARNLAREAGATALVVVTGEEFAATTFRRLADGSRVPRRVVPLGEAEDIPVFNLTRAAAEGVVARAGRTLADLPATPAGALPLPGLEARFAARSAVQDRARAPNVVAIVPGSDPQLAGEYVILSAHMDHVGVGEPVDGDSIYNGADDNGSGTAALMEIAGAIASLPAPPRRSIVFLHVSGEEKGLLGSRWYSDHPTVPLERVVANINVDMIGRNAPDSVVVIGQEYSSLGPLVQRVAMANPGLGLVVAGDLWPEQRFFFRSDHFNFARKEIPALFFFTGVHEDYHRPSDHAEKLDVDKAARIARLVYHTALEIADADDRPTWDPAGLEQVRAITR